MVGFLWHMPIVGTASGGFGGACYSSPDFLVTPNVHIAVILPFGQQAKAQTASHLGRRKGKAA